jgi:hypothetical protein
MSLSSLEIAFDGDDYWADRFGGSRARTPDRIHSTPRDGDKNVMSGQGILLFGDRCMCRFGGFILRDAKLCVAPQDEVLDPLGEERGKAARLEP